MKSKGYEKKVIPVLVNLKNPLTHDYEGSSFPDSYKKTNYPTEYIAARQVASAIKEGKDGVVYENIIDPLNSNSYGIFETEQIYMLRSEEDKAGFKNFVAQQAPQTRPSFQITETEAVGETGGPFPGLIQNQKGIPTVLNPETNEVIKPALLYNEQNFVSGNVYNLTAQSVKEIGAANPGKLFVFDDYFLTETGASMDGIDMSNTRQAWMSGKAAGISFGIPTLSTRASTSIPVTDQNYDKLKAQIDKALDGLLEKKRQGNELIFPSRGMGQNFIGFDIQPKENVRTNNRAAPSLFVYLSKRLLQDFGYVNPELSDLAINTPGVKPILGTETGGEFVQGYYKSIGAQTVTDTDIKEFIKKCKGLS